MHVCACVVNSCEPPPPPPLVHSLDMFPLIWRSGSCLLAFFQQLWGLYGNSQLCVTLASIVLHCGIVASVLNLGCIINYNWLSLAYVATVLAVVSVLVSRRGENATSWMFLLAVRGMVVCLRGAAVRPGSLSNYCTYLAGSEPRKWTKQPSSHAFDIPSSTFWG